MVSTPQLLYITKHPLSGYFRKGFAAAYLAELLQVTPVGQDRVRAEAALGGEMVQIALNRCGELHIRSPWVPASAVLR